MRKIKIPYKLAGDDFIYDGLIYDNKQDYFKDLLKYCYEGKGGAISFQGQPHTEMECLEYRKRMKLLRNPQTRKIILDNCEQEDYIIVINSKFKNID